MIGFACKTFSRKLSKTLPNISKSQQKQINCNQEQIIVTISTKSCNQNKNTLYEPHKIPDLEGKGRRWDLREMNGGRWVGRGGSVRMRDGLMEVGRQSSLRTRDGSAKDEDKGWVGEDVGWVIGVGWVTEMGWVGEVPSPCSA